MKTFIATLLPFLFLLPAESFGSIDCTRDLSLPPAFIELLKTQPGLRVQRLDVKSVEVQLPANDEDGAEASYISKPERAHKKRVDIALEVRQYLKAIPQAKTVKTLIYAAAGFDSSIPFLILPKLETTIAIDNHPFIRDSLDVDSNRYEAESGIGTIWEIAGDVTRASSLADAMVYRLTMDVPDVRITNVSVFYDEQPVMPWRDESRTGTHGVIEFDTGPGTVKRRHIHIDGVLTSVQRNPPWWLQAVLMSRYEGLLVKAAMTLYGGQPGIEPIEANQIVEKIFERGGLIIDGDKTAGSLWLTDSRAVEFQTWIQTFGYKELTIFQVKAPK